MLLAGLETVGNEIVVETSFLTVWKRRVLRLMVAEKASVVGSPLGAVFLSEASGWVARPGLGDGDAGAARRLSLSGGALDRFDPSWWSSECFRPPPLPPTAEAAAVDKSMNVEKRRTRSRLMTAKRPVGVVSS